MSVKLELSHNGIEIKFFNKDYGIIGFADYTRLIWEEISKVNWYVDEKKFINGEKTYIYTGSSRFGEIYQLHQIVMKFWYGADALQIAYEKKYIVEHHNNNAFDCHVVNLSFASNDLNLTKAHSFDKNQPKLLKQAAVNFFKDFTTQQYQITIRFTGDFILLQNGKKVYVDKLCFLYENNFRVVYTDANRIVDELLEVGKIDFKLLSFIDYSYVEAKFFVPTEGEELKGIKIITDKDGNNYMIVAEEAKGKVFFNSTPPDKELYKKDKS